jgi:hypothetical protein
MRKRRQRRQLTAVLLATACLTGLMLAGCASGPQARHGTAQGCYAFAVRALQHHVTVTRLPRACAGMTRAEVNLAVGRAIRDVVGPLHKAAARRAEYLEGRYLEHLVKPVRPAPPPPVAAATSGQPGSLPVSLAALAAWLVTALAGSYLLAGWLAGMSERGFRRKLRSLPVTVICHFSLALTGLAIWIAFVASNVAALAWVDFALILPVAGLGMAVLFGWLATLVGDSGPDPSPAADAQAETSGAATGQRTPALVIVLHGILATTTILLVLLAAIAA